MEAGTRRRWLLAAVTIALCLSVARTRALAAEVAAANRERDEHEKRSLRQDPDYEGY